MTVVLTNMEHGYSVSHCDWEEARTSWDDVMHGDCNGICSKTRTSEI